MLFPALYDLSQLITDATLFSSEFAIIVTATAAFWAANKVLRLARKNMRS